MKSVLVSIPIFLVFLFFESTIISFPLIFLYSVVLFLTKKNIASCILILIFSLLLDSLRITPLGFTAAFLFGLFTLITFLEKLFAAEGLWLGTIISLIALEVYRHSVSYPFSIVLFSLVMIGAGFFVYIEFKKQNEGQVI